VVPGSERFAQCGLDRLGYAAPEAFDLQEDNVQA